MLHRCNVREWEWEGMGIDCTRMGGSGNVKGHSRSSLPPSHHLAFIRIAGEFRPGGFCSGFADCGLTEHSSCTLRRRVVAFLASIWTSFSEACADRQTSRHRRYSLAAVLLPSTALFTFDANVFSFSLSLSFFANTVENLFIYIAYQILRQA